jgi:hypothetical protein
LLFKRGAGDSPLVVQPLDGRPEHTLVACVRGSDSDGDSTSPPTLSRCAGRPACAAGATGDEVLGTLEKFGGSSTIAVSADGRTVLYTKVTGEGSDLMVIEDFR